MEKEARSVVQAAAPLAMEALELSRNSILVNLRFMETAFSRLDFRPLPGAELHTNSIHIVYDPAQIVRVYAREPSELTRDYLHIVLHCVFQHLFIGEPTIPLYWDLACDIAVESTISDLGLAVCDCARAREQSSVVDELKDRLPLLTAEKIYRLFRDEGLDQDKALSMRELFYADDHLSWYDFTSGDESSSDEAGAGSAGQQAPAGIEGKNGTDTKLPEKNSERHHQASQGMDSDLITPKEQPQNMKQALGNRYMDTISLDRSREQWENAAYEMGVALDHFAKMWGAQGSNLSMTLAAVTREKYDYSDFLRKFAAYSEEIEVNDNEFDYIFYCYGLQLFDNLPLIEPLEYVDTRRIRDFVIAIDTSASTKDVLVQKFVTKTYNILQEETSFSSRMNLFIIQCDAEITDVARISSKSDFDDYIANMTIKGLGGTDFRPVFTYVDDLIERHELVDMRGLIYFTDGQGTYPAKKPDYDTAFVFLDDDLTSRNVPSWAMKVVLESEDIHRFDQTYRPRQIRN